MVFIFFGRTLTLTSEHVYLCIILGSGNNCLNIYNSMKISGGHGCFGGRIDEYLKGKGMIAIPSSTKNSWEVTLLSGIPQGSSRCHRVTKESAPIDSAFSVSSICGVIRFLVPVLHFIHAICPVICYFNAIWNLLSCSWTLDSVMCLSLANGMWTEVTGPGLKTPCLFCSTHFSSTITIRMTCPG